MFVESLNEGADAAANDGADAADKKGEQWLRYPFGGGGFALVWQGGIVTGNARRFMRARMSEQALHYCASKHLRDQGAVFRNSKSVDMKAASRRMAGAHVAPFTRRLFNGSAAAQNTLRHRHKKLKSALGLDGFKCQLCASDRQGNLRHILCCEGGGTKVQTARAEFFATVEKVFTTAETAGNFDDSLLAKKAGGKIGGRNVCGVDETCPYVSRSGLWGKLKYVDDGVLVCGFGDPCNMSAETGEDLGYRGVFPLDLRTCLETVWKSSVEERALVSPRTMETQVADFLETLGTVVAEAILVYWLVYATGLEEKFKSQGIIRWRSNEVVGEEIVVPSAVGHKCISGPLCSHLEVNQKIGRTKNPMTRCDKCNRVCLRVELDRQLEILVRQPKDANRGFIFSGCQKEAVNGIYRANGNQRGGQPIFTNSRTALLLFYQPSRQCWVVRDTTERAQWTEFAAKVVPTIWHRTCRDLTFAIGGVKGWGCPVSDEHSDEPGHHWVALAGLSVLRETAGEDTELVKQWRAQLPSLRNMQTQCTAKMALTQHTGQPRTASAAKLEHHVRQEKLSYTVNWEVTGRGATVRELTRTQRG